MKRYTWAASGDVNAFFGLMLDNLAGMVLTVGLLQINFDFPATFAMRYMIPGTALGVLVGDLIYTVMALRLARRAGRNDITAMPLGLDTPSTFGMVFLVLGPAFLAAKGAGFSEEEAARRAWHIGICCLVASGTFKLACSLVSGWVRRNLPRAGLLGSLAAVALVLISFFPLLDVFRYPVVGLMSLGIILTTLVARIEIPGRIPGTLAALVTAGGVYYAAVALGAIEPAPAMVNPADGLRPTGWLEVFRFEWMAAWRDTLHYLPIVIPFALATVVGGIDCTESAAAAGDEYPTGPIIAVEGLATVVAGLCGGVIQSTPYIGHPAYKAMGARAGYTLATALFIGSAGLLGYFGYLYVWIPKAAIFPILIFIGLEITAQSYAATPKRHYPALALATVPALAYLVMTLTDQTLFAGGTSVEQLAEPTGPGGEPSTWLPLAENLYTIRLLAHGFIVTSLLWASAMAALVDRRLRLAASFFAVAAVAAAFGVIHSPLRGNPLVLPWQLPDGVPAVPGGQTPWAIAGGYLLLAALLAAWSLLPSGAGARPNPAEPADGGPAAAVPSTD